MCENQYAFGMLSFSAECDWRPQRCFLVLSLNLQSLFFGALRQVRAIVSASYEFGFCQPVNGIMPHTITMILTYQIRTNFARARS